MKIFGTDSGSFKKDRVGDASKSGKAKSSSAVSGTADKAKQAAGSSTVGEKILVSDLGKEIAKIHDQLKKSPDIRVDVVRELKEKIDEDTYHVPSNKIAGKIIEDIIKQGE